MDDLIFKITFSVEIFGMLVSAFCITVIGPIMLIALAPWMVPVFVPVIAAILFITLAPTDYMGGY